MIESLLSGDNNLHQSIVKALDACNRVTKSFGDDYSDPTETKVKSWHKTGINGEVSSPDMSSMGGTKSMRQALVTGRPMEMSCHITWLMTLHECRGSATASAGPDAHSQSPAIQDPPGYAEVGYVDGPLVRVGRSTGAKTNQLMCGTGDEVLNPGQTVTKGLYKEQLSGVDEAPRQQGVNTAAVKFLHDKIEKLGWELLPHPLYSPDLAPPDYHLFGSTQHSLAENKLRNRDQVEIWVSTFFESQPPEFFKKGIHFLRGLWRNVIDNNGDYHFY
ncbi:unnamed protein product [Heligmosomoides polygyrus]|uniref:Histone-lysine N-methyltransferase SETMAR n=1 Tax=Heligmosomoides polygyrus TaxID=6339 RepID=A0A183FTA9_HELPZ|nr:unnamed protein product [Heligmosomoides polygyrus]